jgi:ABC-type Fe3+ transport system substrate-binding protein
MPNPAEGGAAALMFAAQRESMGDDAWKAWLEGIKANNPTMTGSSSEAYATVLRGDRPLCVCSYGDFVEQDEGTPMAPAYYNQDTTGMIFNPNIAVIASEAPHPATAALFVNWAIDPEGGQLAFVESGRAPALDSDQVEGAEDVGLPADVKGAPIFEVMADYIDDPDSFIAVYQDIFG